MKGTPLLRERLTAARFTAARFLMLHADQLRVLGQRATGPDFAAMHEARARYDQTTRRLRALTR